MTYSVWLSVDDDQLRHAHRVWTTDAYRDLTLEGTVANAIKPWPELLGESARAVVRDVGTLPYLVAAEQNTLSRVLAEVWDRDDVLSLLWHACRSQCVNRSRRTGQSNGPPASRRA